jgi:hypothetical protein
MNHALQIMPHEFPHRWFGWWRRILTGGQRCLPIGGRQGNRYTRAKNNQYLQMDLGPLIPGDYQLAPSGNNLARRHKMKRLKQNTGSPTFAKLQEAELLQEARWGRTKHREGHSRSGDDNSRRRRSGPSRKTHGSTTCDMGHIYGSQPPVEKQESRICKCRRDRVLMSGMSCRFSLRAAVQTQWWVSICICFLGRSLSLVSEHWVSWCARQIMSSDPRAAHLPQAGQHRTGAAGPYPLNFNWSRAHRKVRAFWVNFCVFNGHFRQYFQNLHHLLHGFRKY